MGCNFCLFFVTTYVFFMNICFSCYVKKHCPISFKKRAPSKTPIYVKKTFFEKFVTYMTHARNHENAFLLIFFQKVSLERCFWYGWIQFFIGNLPILSSRANSVYFLKKLLHFSFCQKWLWTLPIFCYKHTSFSWTSVFYTTWKSIFQ